MHEGDNASPNSNRATWWTATILALGLVAALTWRFSGDSTGPFQGLQPQAGEALQPGWARVDGSVNLAELNALPRLDTGPGDRGRIDLDGTVLLNVWASWCGPCTQELPLLARLDRTTDLHVVGLSRDPLESSAREAIDVAGTAYPNALDQAAEFTETLIPIVGTQNVPVSILLEDGEATWAHFGSFDSYNELRTTIAGRTSATS